MTVRCADQPGIVHSFSDAILKAGGNIVESAQFEDSLSGTFCMRTRFSTELATAEEVRRHFEATASRLGAEVVIRSETHRQRALIMVSKFDHCLVDLLYRWRANELAIDIPVVVSNHGDLRSIVEREGIRFVHLPVTKENKPEQEQRLLDEVQRESIDFVVLARYMQVLSEDLCAKLPGRVINIHHSFLPGFKGARPYFQAYERGVKLIGATAHFVTSDLDEGPIIEQDVVRVNHTATAEQLTVMGRDVERQVLSRAVRFQAESRIIRLGSRTVVFS
jgi:formyltetrahydrofolate deformylase